MLWVQEAFAPVGKPEAVGKRPKATTLPLADSAYMRDGWRQYRSGHGEAGAPPDNSFGRLSWFQAVHMPLWASRLFLQVESVRIESLQFISKNDVVSEGYKADWRPWRSPIDDYRKHWDSVRGTPGERWGDNPAVVVLSFLRCAAPSPTSIAAPHHSG